MITLYKPGNTHNVNGIKCTLQNFKNSRTVEAMVREGWFKSPEDCYPKKEVKEKEKEKGNLNIATVTIEPVKSVESIADLRKEENENNSTIDELKKNLEELKNGAKEKPEKGEIKKEKANSSK